MTHDSPRAALAPRHATTLWMRPWTHLVALVLLGAAIYLPFLATRPFDASEGHRVVPGWTMLSTGEFWNIQLFELTYFRKPPGMPWAVALSSSVFGQTVFAARLVSAVCAIAAGVVAWWFTRRWLVRGRVEPSDAALPALGAGCAQLLMPLMWSAGRTAEIEMLMLLGVQLGALGILDLLLGSQSRRAAFVSLIIATIGVCISIIAKGPAGLPAIGAVVVGYAICTRSFRPFVHPRLLALVALVVMLLTPIGMKLVIANASPDAVREEIAEQFLWNRERLVGVLLLLPLAFVSALPMSLGVLFPFGPDARAEAQRSHALAGALAFAKPLAIAWLIAVGVLVVLGMSNPRYAMPAAVLLPPIAGYVLLGLAAGTGPRLASFGRARSIIARLCVLGHPLVVLAALIIGAGVMLTLAARPTPDQLAGPAAAEALARALAASPSDHTEPPIVLADHAIEARPDIVHLFANRAHARVIWAKRDLESGHLPNSHTTTTASPPKPPAAMMLLRTDPGSAEGRTYADAIASGRLVKLASVAVRTFEFTLFRVVDQAPRPG